MKLDIKGRIHRSGGSGITQARLQELLDYNHDTGVLVNRVSRAISAQAGKVAGWINGDGYRRIHIDGKDYLAHRLIWMYCHGKWPEGEIDHISGDRLNNKLVNLRDVSRGENCKNAKIPSDNTSGVIGVCRYKETGKWRAYIQANGKKKHLGWFNDVAMAIVARQMAEVKYGYHVNHGREK